MLLPVHYIVISLCNDVLSIFSGCSITDVTDNVCGQEMCLAGPEGYTCGGERTEPQKAWFW